MKLYKVLDTWNVLMVVEGSRLAAGIPFGLVANCDLLPFGALVPGAKGESKVGITLGCDNSEKMRGWDKRQMLKYNTIAPLHLFQQFQSIQLHGQVLRLSSLLILTIQ
jgi:hypothetical protein